MNIVSYVEMNADKLKAKIGSPQLSIDFLREFDSKQYKIVEEIKNNTHIVNCIPLDDINSFSLTQKLTENEYEILQKNGFVLNGTDEYDNYFYIRKELLF